MFQGKRLLPVFIYKILRQYSSKQHPLTQHDIMRYLERDYGVEKIDPKTITRCLDDFEYMGWPLSRNKRLGAYLAEIFTQTELKVLLAPMYMASYLSNADVAKLLKKLGKINESQRRELSRNTAIAKSYRHLDQNDFFQKIEAIDSAIVKRRQLQFIYNDLDEKGQLVPRCGSGGDPIRLVHPMGMVYFNGFFYFVGAKGEDLKVLNYRIDKMTGVYVTEEEAVPVGQIPGYEEGFFSAPDYVHRNFKMFNTPPQIVRFRIQVPEPKRLNLYINTVWDEFGKRLQWMEKKDPCTLEFEVKVPLIGAKIFAMQYATVAEVLSPADLRLELREEFHKNWAKYK